MGRGKKRVGVNTRAVRKVRTLSSGLTPATSKQRGVASLFARAEAAGWKAGPFPSPADAQAFLDKAGPSRRGDFQQELPLGPRAKPLGLRGARAPAELARQYAAKHPEIKPHKIKGAVAKGLMALRRGTFKQHLEAGTGRWVTINGARVFIVEK